jgi:hypothetical protein
MKRSIVLCLATIVVCLTTNASGDYYEFSAYAGGGYEYDVDSYGNTVYWRPAFSSYSTVYAVDVSVADPSKKDEPKMTPGSDGIYGTADDLANANYQTRNFSNERSFTLAVPSGYSLQAGSHSELWVDSSNVYIVATDGSVLGFNKTTGAHVSTLAYSSGLPGSSGYGYKSFLSYGGGKWWIGDENRRVYSSTDGKNWTYEFTWANMAGGHGDGMEYVNGHLFVSDMTSNWIAMWDENAGTWSETDKFSYTEEFGGSSKHVEGMGHGALGHFWAGSGSYIYELGGGEIQEYVIPVPGALLLGLLGLGSAGLKLRRRFV